MQPVTKLNYIHSISKRSETKEGMTTEDLCRIKGHIFSVYRIIHQIFIHNPTFFITGHEHKSVDCGGYRKPDCDQCILYRYLSRYLWYLWCNQDCTWNWDQYVCELSKTFLSK